MATALIPAQYLFQTFNAFDPRIAQEPNRLFNFTNDYSNGQLNPSQIDNQTLAQNFVGVYEEHRSFEEIKTQFAASVGINGSYGVFSGSLQASAQQDSDQSSTTFNSSYRATIDCGTCSFFRPDDLDAVRVGLLPALVTDLDRITTMQMAKDFVAKYGTHVVLGVNLGGSLQVSVYSTTTSLILQQQLAIDAKAKYSAVSSIEVTASVTQSFASDHSSSDLVTAVKAVGGSSTVAMMITPNSPSTFSDWGNTCTVDTVCGVSNSKELWELASNPTAKTILQQYVQLVALERSIEYPSIFSSSVSVQAYRETTVVATADADFKIIGGGVAVTQNSNNFITGSYPKLDPQGTIIGWTAASHDLVDAAADSDVLTAYAIAIYDPANLIVTAYVVTSGENIGAGSDSATASVPDGQTRCGGGVRIDAVGGIKFLMQSFPSGSNGWTGMIHDYQTPASNVELGVYAIGLMSTHFDIVATLTNSQIDRIQAGNAVAKTVGGIAGGGVSVIYLGGMGNLVQQSYPQSRTAWAEFNKDTANNPSPASSVAYALQLKASMPLAQMT